VLLYAIDGEVLIFFFLLLLSRERERERQIKRGDVFVGLHCTSRAGKQARKEGRKEGRELVLLKAIVWFVFLPLRYKIEDRRHPSSFNKLFISCACVCMEVYLCG
jgi:hypothetical protein